MTEKSSIVKGMKRWVIFLRQWAGDDTYSFKCLTGLHHSGDVTLKFNKRRWSSIRSLDDEWQATKPNERRPREKIDAQDTAEDEEWNGLIRLSQTRSNLSAYGLSSSRWPTPA